MWKLRVLSVMLTAACCGPKTSYAQDPTKRESSSVSENAAKISLQKEENIPPVHPFRDKENTGLFAGVAAARTLDYFSTLNMRRRGRQEIFLTNEVVDNHAAFASVEAATTGSSIGASYLFHRYGHPKLERWTSFIHIGVATSGAVRNYCLKTAHPKTTP